MGALLIQGPTSTGQAKAGIEKRAHRILYTLSLAGISHHTSQSHELYQNHVPTRQPTPETITLWDLTVHVPPTFWSPLPTSLSTSTSTYIAVYVYVNLIKLLSSLTSLV